jgi:hypothetical protein
MGTDHTAAAKYKCECKPGYVLNDAASVCVREFAAGEVGAADKPKHLVYPADNTRLNPQLDSLFSVPVRLWCCCHMLRGGKAWSLWHSAHLFVKAI